MSDTAPEVMDPAQVSELLRSNAGVRLVDVRTPAEYRSAHIPGSHNVPLAQLPERGDDLLADDEKVLVLVCASGERAERARKALDAAGTSNVAVLRGGITAWADHGAELSRGASAPWPMERQVRLAAGSLVLAGVLGSLGYEPLKWLAGFIGAGLAFAGLTNTCGMARVLALLPYNRGSGRRQSSIDDVQADVR